jgi:sulfur-carrier protein
MKIRVKTFAQIKDILGEDSSFEYPDGTPMKELLKSLRQRAGESENQLFSREGELHSHFVLMIPSIGSVSQVRTSYRQFPGQG